MFPERTCAADDCSGLLVPGTPRQRRYCSQTCRDRAKAQRVWCQTHPDGVLSRHVAGRGASSDDKFWVKVGDRSSCWLWIGSRDQNGYGLFRCDGLYKAHRWAYARWVGSLVDGLTVDHLCGVKSCVNPSHLEQISRSENIRRGYAARPCV